MAVPKRKVSRARRDKRRSNVCKLPIPAFSKCTQCGDRVAEGKQPICVEACPVRALDFGEIEDLRAKYGDVAEIAPLPEASLTKPNLVITAPAQAKPANDTTGTVENEVELV